MNRSPGETENRSSACGTVFLWDFVLLTEIFRQRRSLPVFLSQFPAPPETPRGTGKLGEVANRDIVHSGKSFCIRGKTCLFGKPRSPQRGRLVICFVISTASSFGKR